MSDKNKALNEMYKLIDNDMYAMTFQSIAQYRSALKCEIVRMMDASGSLIDMPMNLNTVEEFESWLNEVMKSCV